MKPARARITDMLRVVGASSFALTMASSRWASDAHVGAR